MSTRVSGNAHSTMPVLHRRSSLANSDSLFIRGAWYDSATQNRWPVRNDPSYASPDVTLSHSGWANMVTRLVVFFWSLSND